MKENIMWKIPHVLGINLSTNTVICKLRISNEGAYWLHNALHYPGDDTKAIQHLVSYWKQYGRFNYFQVSFKIDDTPIATLLEKAIAECKWRVIQLKEAVLKQEMQRRKSAYDIYNTGEDI